MLSRSFVFHILLEAVYSLLSRSVFWTTFCLFRSFGLGKWGRLCSPSEGMSCTSLSWCHFVVILKLSACNLAIFTETFFSSCKVQNWLRDRPPRSRRAVESVVVLACEQVLCGLRFHLFYREGQRVHGLIMFAIYRAPYFEAFSDLLCSLRITESLQNTIRFWKYALLKVSLLKTL